MQYRRTFAPLFLLTALIACGGDDGPATTAPATFDEACAAVAGCETPRVVVGAATVPIWRVLVVRDGAGVVRIEAVQETAVSREIGLPPSAAGGAYAVAALDAAGAPLEVHAIRFPETMRFESPYGLDSEEVDLSGEEVSAVGYLRVSEDVATLAVVEPPGEVVFSQEAPAPGEAIVEPGPVGARREALVQAAPGSACGHVMLLEGPWDEIWYPRGLWEVDPLREVTPLQRAVVQAALGRVQPILCAAVGRVAFAAFDAFNTGGRTRNWPLAHIGDLIVLNAAFEFEGITFGDDSLVDPLPRAFLTHSVIHESVHAAGFLLERAGGDARFTGEWTPAARDLAGETVYRARVRGSFRTSWAELHAGFLGIGWSQPYWAGFWGDSRDDARLAAAKAADPDGLARWGAMSAYGASNVDDDVCEMVSWPLVADDYRAAGAESGPPPDANDFGCLALQAHTEETVPQHLAAVYTKLSFVRDLGFIDEEAFDRCRGDAVGLPRDTEGIVVYEDGEALRSFTVGPEAGIGTRGGRYLFTFYVSGDAVFDGETYDAGLELEIDLGPTVDGEGAPVHIDDISWPRGVYQLVPGQPHAFRLRMPDAPAGNFDVTDGFVLVASATNDRIVGSVFVRQAYRNQAPIPVPQVFDPPLQFRFLIEN